MSEIDTTIATPQDTAEKTGESTEQHFDLRFIDAQMDTLQVALIDYLEERGEKDAADGVRALWELSCYSVNHALYPENDFSLDIANDALARMSNIVPKLGGHFIGPSGYSI